MDKTISTYKLLECIGSKATLSDLQITQSDVESCIEIKELFPDYIEPILAYPLYGLDTPIDQHPRIILISAAGATGKTSMCRYLSSTLNIPVFDLSKEREVASNSLTGALVKKFGTSFSTYLDAVQKGKQALIIDALDEGLAKSGASAFNAFLDDVISFISNTSSSSIPIIMLGRTQSIGSISNYLDKNSVTYSWLQICAFTRDKANEYIDKKVKPQEKFAKPYKDLKKYIFDAIGSYVSNQSMVGSDFLGYAPVLDAISVALRQHCNYQAMLEEYKTNSTSGISFILDVINHIILREKYDKVNTIISNFKNDLTFGEYSIAKQQTYDSLEQCKALMAFLFSDKYKFEICSQERINKEFSDKLASFIEDHPFLNGKRFENTVFESYVLARLMIEDPENIYLDCYLSDPSYRDAYMLFYFFVELLNNRQLQWRFVPYIYRSLISFDNRDDFGQTFIQQENDSKTHAIRMTRQNGDKELEFECDLFNDKVFNPGNILSNITIDSQIIDVCLDAKSLEIVPPVVCICNTITVGSDIVVNDLPKDRNETSDDFRLIFECRNFNVDFQSGHRPSVKLNNNGLLSINSENRLMPPFTDYETKVSYEGDFSNDFRSAFVKLRKILITFRSHSKGSMARYKGKIDDSRISGHDIGKPLIKRLLQKGIIEENGCMYHLNRDKTAEVLGLTFDKLQTTSPTPKMVDFIKDALNEKF